MIRGVYIGNELGLRGKFKFWILKGKDSWKLFLKNIGESKGQKSYSLCWQESYPDRDMLMSRSGHWSRAGPDRDRGSWYALPKRKKKEEKGFLGVTIVTRLVPSGIYVPSLVTIVTSVRDLHCQEMAKCNPDVPVGTVNVPREPKMPLWSKNFENKQIGPKNLFN